MHASHPVRVVFRKVGRIRAIIEVCRRDLLVGTPLDKGIEARQKEREWKCSGMSQNNSGLNKIRRPAEKIQRWEFENIKHGEGFGSSWRIVLIEGVYLTKVQLHVDPPGQSCVVRSTRRRSPYTQKPYRAVIPAKPVLP